MVILENGKKVRYNIGKGLIVGLGTICDCRVDSSEQRHDGGCLYKLTDLEFCGNITEFLKDDGEFWVSDYQCEDLELDKFVVLGGVACSSGYIAISDPKASMDPFNYNQLEGQFKARGLPTSLALNHQGGAANMSVVLKVPRNGQPYKVHVKHNEFGIISEMKILFD